MSSPDTDLRRVEDTLVAGDGKALFRRAWLPPDPQRVLVVVHGFGEHCGRYEELATWFAHRGFAVHAYDQRGHGRTPGARGDIGRFDLLLDDVARMLDFAADSHPGLPLILLGHSMGGLITTAFVCERQPQIDRFAVSGPALLLAPDFSPMKVRIARALAGVCPRLSMDAGLDAEAISRDPEVVRRYVDDPLVHGTMTAALAGGMVAAQTRTLEAASRVAMPMLLLHGEADALCPVEGSKRFHEGLPHERVAGSAIRTYPGLRHEIFNEPEREQVYEDLLTWLDAPAGGEPPERNAT